MHKLAEQEEKDSIITKREHLEEENAALKRENQALKERMQEMVEDLMALFDEVEKFKSIVAKK